jgi:hypothetical protein
MQATATQREGTASNLSLLSVGVLSFRAHQTIRRALELHANAGLTKLPAEFFVYFNALCAEDEQLAKAAGVPYRGSPRNTGIYGGFRAIAEFATHPYILILENDIVPLEGADIAGCLESCLSDMREHGIKIFCLRSRAFPGQGGTWRKYAKCFPIIDPINPNISPCKPSVTSKISMLMAHGYLSKFYGSAIYIEKNPEKVQPRAIRKLPSGNYITDSRFRNWSNQSVLVERDYFLNTICRRVEEKPDRRLVHGFQDIERALNSWWWRRQREPMGHAAQGVFTHARLDR